MECGGNAAAFRFVCEERHVAVLAASSEANARQDRSVAVLAMRMEKRRRRPPHSTWIRAERVRVRCFKTIRNKRASSPVAREGALHKRSPALCGVRGIMPGATAEAVATSKRCSARLRGRYDARTQSTPGKARGHVCSARLRGPPPQDHGTRRWDGGVPRNDGCPSVLRRSARPPQFQMDSRATRQTDAEARASASLPLTPSRSRS